MYGRPENCVHCLWLAIDIVSQIALIHFKLSEAIAKKSPSVLLCSTSNHNHDMHHERDVTYLGVVGQVKVLAPDMFNHVLLYQANQHLLESDDDTSI